MCNKNYKNDCTKGDVVYECVVEDSAEIINLLGKNKKMIFTATTSRNGGFCGESDKDRTKDVNFFLYKMERQMESQTGQKYNVKIIIFHVIHHL